MSQYVVPLEAPVGKENPLLLQGGSDSNLEAQQRNYSPDQGLKIPVGKENPLLLQGGSDSHLEAQQRNDSPDQGLKIEVKAAIEVLTRRPRMILMSVLGLVVLSSFLYFLSALSAGNDALKAELDENWMNQRERVITCLRLPGIPSQAGRPTL